MTNRQLAAIMITIMMMSQKQDLRMTKEDDDEDSIRDYKLIVKMIFEKLDLPY